MARSKYLKLTLLSAVVLLGFALRLAPWGENRFLEDEALYAYWGLQIASGADARLDLEPLDKPPLYPYALAASQSFTGLAQPQPAYGDEFLALAPEVTTLSGPSGAQGGASPAEVVSANSAARAEAAARLPSLLASETSLALVYALGYTLFKDWRVGLLAAILLALSPFDILFASTAFTDPLMTAFVLAALLLASTGRLGWSGLFAGLAVATKQQGLLFVPLIVTVGLVFGSIQHRTWTAWLRFAATLTAVIAGVLLWDSVRLQRPGFIEQGFISYGGLGPAQPADLAQRALAWLELVNGFWGSLAFSLLALGALVAWALVSIRGQRTFVLPAYAPASSKNSRLGRLRPLLMRADLMIALFLLSYLVIHWFLGFQVWDRYLLALIPLVSLLLARALVGLWATLPAPAWRSVATVAFAILVLALLTAPVSRATRSEMAIGGDHGAYDGIEDLALSVRATAPAESVLYHHWLGYHYRFYLYGAPLRTHWYPTLDGLAQDATVYRREPRFIAFPSWKDSQPARQALARAGITLQPITETRRRDGSISFRLYQLQGP